MNRLFCNRGKPPNVIRVIYLLALMTVLANSTALFASAPDWLRSSARTELPKYAETTEAVMLLNRQVTTVNNGGETKSVYRKAFRIMRPEGRRFATVRVFFDSETRISSFKGWSISADGQEFEVKDKDAVETSLFAEALYADTRCKVMRIPGAEPGSVIGYEYEQKRRPQILQENWTFQAEIPVKNAQLLLELPAGWEFQSFWANHPAEQARSVGENRWSWQLQDVPALEPEPAMPARRAVTGRLGLTYYPRTGSALAGLGTWREIGLWYSQLTYAAGESNPEIRKKVATLLVGATDVEEKLRRLAAYVQREIRYVAIEIGIGSFRPHASSETFKNSYGDCKDKVNLLRTMLKEAGLESYYVLINTERGVVQPSFPSALNFNHTIIAIRLQGETPGANFYATVTHPRLGQLLLFDPTDTATPLGLLPPSLQANYGLLVTNASGELIEIPALRPAINRLSRTARFKLDESGNLSGDVEEVRSGALAVEYRSRLLAVQSSERAKIISDFLGENLSDWRLTRAGVENLQSADKELVLGYHVEVQRYAQKAGDLILLRPRVLGHKASDLPEGKLRRYPLEFPYESVQSDVFDISLPPGFEIDELPQHVEAETQLAHYQSKTEALAGMIRYSRTYERKKVMASAEQFEELRRFYRQIRTDEQSTAVIKRRSRP
jgi:hypothetical protein